MYVGMVGTPMPRMSEAIMVKTSVSAMLPCASAVIAPDSFTPKPVMVATPTTMPITAQAIATPSAPRAPRWSDSSSSQTVPRVAGRTRHAAIRIPCSAKAPVTP